MSGMGKGSNARLSKKLKRKPDETQKPKKAAKAPKLQSGTRGGRRGRAKVDAEEDDDDVTGVPVVIDHKLQQDADDESADDDDDDSDDDDDGSDDGSGGGEDDNGSDSDEGADVDDGSGGEDGSDDNDDELADDDDGGSGDDEVIVLSGSDSDGEEDGSPVKTQSQANKKTDKKTSKKKSKSKEPDSKKKSAKTSKKNSKNKEPGSKKKSAKEPAAAAAVMVIPSGDGTRKTIVVKIGLKVGVSRSHRDFPRRTAPFEFGVVAKIFYGRDAMDIDWEVSPFGHHRRVPISMVVPVVVGEKANADHAAKRNATPSEPATATAGAKEKAVAKGKGKGKATTPKNEQFWPTPSDAKALNAVQLKYGGTHAELTAEMTKKEDDRKQELKEHKGKMAVSRIDIADLKLRIEVVKNAEAHLKSLTSLADDLTQFIVVSFGQSAQVIAEIFGNLFAAVDLVKVAYHDDHDEALMMPTPTIVSCIKAAIKAVAEKEAAMADAVPTDQRATPEDTPTATADDHAVATGPGTVSSTNVSSADVASVVAPADVLPAGVALAVVAPADIPPATAAGGSVPAHVNVEGAESTAEDAATDAAQIAATLEAESSAAAAVRGAN